jgi:hypothetical protein
LPSRSDADSVFVTPPVVRYPNNLRETPAGQGSCAAA